MAGNRVERCFKIMKNVDGTVSNTVRRIQHAYVDSEQELDEARRKVLLIDEHIKKIKALSTTPSSDTPPKNRDEVVNINNFDTLETDQEDTLERDEEDTLEMDEEDWEENFDELNMEHEIDKRFEETKDYAEYICKGNSPPWNDETFEGYCHDEINRIFDLIERYKAILKGIGNNGMRE